MEWQYDWELSFSFFIVLYLFFYLLYLLRLYRVSRVLGSYFRRHVLYKFLLRSLALACLLLALLGPSWGRSLQKITVEGKDIFFCVDLSESMNTRDISPSRLARVKFELKRMVQSLAGNRLGIVMFSNEAFMQCPLTYDPSALNLFLDALNTKLVPRTGTDFEPPLRMAFEKLKKDPIVYGKKVAKVIVLISDGEDFGDQAEELVPKIKQAGIHMFTLGIGTTQGGNVPGTHGGKKYDKKGKEVRSRLQTKTLRNLAALANGKYFEINREQNGVNSLLEELNEIQGVERESRVRDLGSNKYAYALLAALLFLCI
ncbi:MAG: VWA domain-containing protein, partial [Cytophagales bacterium]|nr:VWA domain-containing protein [Cytophagales bacterium]